MNTSIWQAINKQALAPDQPSNELFLQYLKFAATHEPEKLFETLGTTLHGLTAEG